MKKEALHRGFDIESGKLSKHVRDGKGEAADKPTIVEACLDPVTRVLDIDALRKTLSIPSDNWGTSQFTL